MMENIQKTESGMQQSLGRSKQLSSTEDVIFIDDVLNAIAKIESPKSSQQSAARTSIEDYCPFPEELTPERTAGLFA